MKMSVEEAYEILGVTKDSSDEEIKASYRRLALQTHPDKNRDDPVAHQKFLKVSEAYRRIIDPQQSDELDEDMMGEDYDDDDYETLFAFRMFERMFSFGSGVGFRGDRKNTCHCWECRNSKNFFIPKPQTKYIPKSQRPKDPKEEAKKQPNTSNPHEDWLSDEEVKSASNKVKKAPAKKSTAKKKSAKKSTDPFSYLKNDNDKEPTDEAPKESDPTAHKPGQDSSVAPGDTSDSGEDDDIITAEEMATRMRGAPVLQAKVKSNDSKTALSNSTSKGASVPPSIAKVDDKVKSLPEKHTGAIAPSLPKQLAKPSGVVKKAPPSGSILNKEPYPILCMPAMSTIGVQKKDNVPVIAVSKYKTQVNALVEMGFESSIALRALEESNGVIEDATNLLLSEGGKSNSTAHRAKQASNSHTTEYQPQSLHVSSLKDMTAKLTTKVNNVSEPVKQSVTIEPKSVSVPTPGNYNQRATGAVSANDLPPPVFPKTGFAVGIKPEPRSPPALRNGDLARTLPVSNAAYGHFDSHLQVLTGMGFTSTASLNALERYNGNLKQAASWLLSQELATESINSQPLASSIAFPPAPISSAGLVGSAWAGDSGRSAPASGQNPPPGLSPISKSITEPIPRSRGPTTPPPVSTQQNDSDLDFDFSDFNKFSPNNSSQSGKSRLLGVSEALSTDMSAAPSLTQSGRTPSTQNADFSSSLLMQSSGPGLLSQQPPPGMEMNRSVGVSDEPFMMYGFQDSFGGGLNSSISSGLGSGFSGSLSDGLGLPSRMNSGLSNGINTSLSIGFENALGGDLMGVLGGHSTSDLSGTATFTRSRGPPDSGVAPTLPPSIGRDTNSGLSGFPDSLFNDNFTESVANAVIGSPSLLNGLSDNRSDSNFRFVNQHHGLTGSNQNEFNSQQASYVSLLAGDKIRSESQVSSFSYASALAAPGASLSTPSSSQASVVSTSSSSPNDAPAGGINASSGGYQKGYKSKACVFFQSPKGCARGDKCTFAHTSDNSMPSYNQNKTYYQNKR